MVARVKTAADVWKGKALHKLVVTYDSDSILQNTDFARAFWIRDAQQKAFPAELELLRKGKSIPGDSKLASLNPELDEKGMLRVQGRILESAVLPLQLFPSFFRKIINSQCR